jgi:hypothetical protein
MPAGAQSSSLDPPLPSPPPSNRDLGGWGGDEAGTLTTLSPVVTGAGRAHCPARIRRPERARRICIVPRPRREID